MKKYILESIGCFAIGFLLFCTMSAQESSYLIMSIVFAIAVFLCTFLLKDKTGCYFNPAIALSFAFTKRITYKQFWAYFLSEIIGFVLAALATLAITFFTSNVMTNQICNLFGQNVGIEASYVFVIIFEVLLTSALVFTYLYAFKNNKNSSKAAFIVGFACGLSFMVSVPVTNGSINLAKTLSSAFVFGFSNYGLIILISTSVLVCCALLGSLLGMFFYKMYKKTKQSN